MQDTQNRSLPSGYQLLEYRIDGVLGGGGFSFVYLAHDSEGGTVAIKEYLPATLALREEGGRVGPSSADNLGGFRHGLKCFFEEGRALAKIEHSNIVRVINFFRANDTVYMVMRYERGKSLQDHIRARQKPLNEAFVRRLFSEMLNGLREVHTHKLLHLDIKPANIHIRLDGSPVLLDFGSARQTLSKADPKLSPSYTPGFASPEQYSDHHQKLGPWSDVYGVGASMYACLIRAAPMAADLRSKQDTLPSATKVGQGIYSEHLLEIIDWCMQLDPLKRPQSVFALQRALLERIPKKPKKTSLLDSIRKKLTGKGAP
jgi:serine/threonine protein kinase